MNESIIIYVDAGDRRAVDEARQSWSTEEFGAGSRIETLPPLGGPDTVGKMTMHCVEPAFVSYLRVKGFHFDLV